MTPDELDTFDQQCQVVMRNVAQMEADELTRLIPVLVDSGNVYVLRGLSSRLADSGAGTDVHLLVFSVLEYLKTHDLNVLTNLMTAVTRLKQDGIAWETPERLVLARRLSERCRGVAEILSEDALDFEQHL